jgi:hypothetical protein
MSTSKQLTGDAGFATGGNNSISRGRKATTVLHDGAHTSKVTRRTTKLLQGDEETQKVSNSQRKSGPLCSRAACVDPMAWNRPEVSNVSEASMLRPKSRGKRGDAKVSSIRSSLFAKMAADNLPGGEDSSPAKCNGGRAPDVEKDDVETKKRNDASIAKRVMALDSELGVGVPPTKT